MSGIWKFILRNHFLTGFWNCRKLDFYQLSNPSKDFESRSNDVFDRLKNLEQQHNIQTKDKPGLVFGEDEVSKSTASNPDIPSNAIVFSRKRANEETAFLRPETKWKKYDLADVNEHQTGELSNRRALDDFFRTRVQPKETKQEEMDDTRLVFKRPMKKEVLVDLKDDDEDDQQFINVRAPTSSSSIPKGKKSKNSLDDDDTSALYRLRTNQKKTRGVLSTTKKSNSEQRTDLSEETSDDSSDGDNQEVDEPFEP